MLAARTGAAPVSASPAMVIVGSDQNTAGAAQSLFGGAGIDACSASADLPLSAGTIASATVIRVAIKVDTQDGPARLAVCNIRVGASVDDEVAQAGKFIVAQLLVEGHAPAAKRFFLVYFDVEERILRVTGHHELSVVAIVASKNVKETSFYAR